MRLRKRFRSAKRLRKRLQRRKQDAKAPRPSDHYGPDLKHMLTHFPKDPKCPVCSNCKMQRKQCRSQHKPDDHPDFPKKFGESITADHMIQGNDEESIRGDKVTCVIMDRATRWIQAYPAKSKSAHDTQRAFAKFLGKVKPDKSLHRWIPGVQVGVARTWTSS